MRARASFYATIFALLAVFAFAAGCAKTPDDAQITSDVQSKINVDSGLQGKQIAVQTATGSVTLSGTVDNEAQRDAAARYAASSPGVKQVVNNIQVAAPSEAQAQAQPEPPPSEPAPAASVEHKPSRSRHHHDRAPKNEDSADAQQETPPATQAQESAPPMPAAPPAQEAVPATPQAPPPPQMMTIPSGTVLSVRLLDPINSETAQQGQTFRATLSTPLSVDGVTAIPAGYEVQGHVVEVQSAGKFKGKSLLTLQLDDLSVRNKRYEIQTDQFHREGSSRGKNTAEKVGGGAVVGAIIGGIFGGGKGAAIGSAAGAGVGGGAQAVTKAQQIDLPTETQLSFTLQAPVTVAQTKRSPHQSDPKLDTDQNNQ